MTGPIPAGRRAIRLALPFTAAWLLMGGATLWKGAEPPYTPEEALERFQLEEGFRIEVVAAEPLVSDPVAMEIDESGRMYVVEMHGYPLDAAGSGRVMLLTDADGDGRADGSTVFAEGLQLPTGIMRWKKGVLVTDSPHVWYLEDSDGDGRADIRRVVLTGFALSNPQHNTNTPVYGLDNWIYLANEGTVQTTRYPNLFGDEGSRVRFPDHPDAPTLPPNADGRNVRFRPDTRELEMLSARSQFGQTFDAWGHQFLVTNNRHIYHEVVPARYLSRNPDLLVTSVVQQLPDYGNPAEVFPITENPEFQLLTDVGIMTSASGLTYYLGDLFPPRYENAVFVAESVHNLVHVAKVRDDGASFRASRMRESREFLASTDAWFRPVNFYVGPDGALYVIDYYRKIIEHPEWLDEATIASGDLYAGRDQGRIYRVVPKDAPRASWMNRLRLDTASDEELVRMLQHRNLWWRRNAQRLLVDRGAEGAVPSLVRLASEGGSAVGRLHALWTLEGMGRLDALLIARALRDESPRIRENAIKLTELHLARAPSLRDPLLKLADDPDPKVRFQLLLTLGGVDSPASAAVRRKLLLDGVEDEWMQLAGLLAPWNAAELYAVAVERLADQGTPGRRALFGRLGTMIGGGGKEEEIRRILHAVATTRVPEAAWWRGASLEGLAAGLRGKKNQAAASDAERDLLLGMIVADEGAPVRRSALQLLDALGLPSGPSRARALQWSTRTLKDRAADPELRADAVRLLALHDPAPYEEVLKEVTRAGEPAPVQLAAVRALGQLRREEIASFLLGRWSQWSPAVREEAVRLLVREPERLGRLIAALESGQVARSEIDRPTRIRLMMTEDEALRARARALFSGPGVEAKQAVARYQAALSLAGNAEQGRQIFTRSCSGCHQYQGAGVAFGPDLAEMRSRPPHALVADILDPSQSIADGYELWRIERTDGGTVTGIIAGETPTAITLRRPGGGESTLFRTEIASMQISELSAMPEGLESQISPEEMADLIAFLKGNR